MKKVSFALVLVMFLFACATSEKYDRKLAGWVGKTESSLVAKWGRPSATRILDNGDKIITYTKANNVNTTFTTRPAPSRAIPCSIRRLWTTMTLAPTARLSAIRSRKSARPHS